MDEATFLDIAKEADVWLYAGDNYDTITSDFSTVPAHANGLVFDFLGSSGPKDWFESRFAQPDVVLEDFITVLYPGVHLDHQRAWWRNVFTEGQTTKLTASSCRDVSEPFVLKSNPCYEIVVPAVDEASDDFAGGAFALGAVAGMAAMGILCGLAIRYSTQAPPPVKGTSN